MAFSSISRPTTSYQSISKPSTTFNSTSKPSTSYSSIVDVAQNFLLINSIDFLLINSSSEKLLIDDTRDSNYTKNAQPSSVTYTSITKPA